MKFKTISCGSVRLMIAVLMMTGLSFASYAAETGNVCPEQSSTQKKFQIENNFDFPITVKIPRDKWICYDYSGYGTPGQAGEEILLPANRLQVLELETRATYPFQQAQKSHFTITAVYYTSPTQYKILTSVRIATDYNRDLILYNPDASYSLSQFKKDETYYRNEFTFGQEVNWNSWRPYGALNRGVVAFKFGKYDSHNPGGPIISFQLDPRQK